MYDPFKFWLRLQEISAANLTAWMAFTSKCWDAGWHQVQCLTQAPPHRRDADSHTPAPCANKGPRLADHYGRRHHDVNVEKI